VIGELCGAGRIDGSVGKLLALAFVRETGVGATGRQKRQNEQYDHIVVVVVLSKIVIRRPCARDGRLKIVQRHDNNNGRR